ncbi:MAG: polysaccharide biosynthesis protein [Clostridiales bacterium]|nr:polysaccharide biosynthesis protein [Clostridiales bacterium]
MKDKQSFVTGAIILGVSGIVAKFLGLFFRWPVTMLIGDEGIGIYQLSYPIYMFILGILSGFPVAISKMVSERIATGKDYQAYRVFKVSLRILSIIGAAASILLYIFAPLILKLLKWRSDAYYSLIAISFAPFFVSVMNGFRGYFQGMQMMSMPAASQIIEQLGRVIVGVGLTYIFMPYGVSISAAGASFGACAGAILGCILLFAGYMVQKKRFLKAAVLDKSQDENIVKELLKIALPISIGMTVGSIMSLIDSAVVPARLLAAGFSQKTATELYGQLTGKAHVLINVPLTFSVALGTSLVPAMSEVKAIRNMDRIKNRAESAIKVSMIVAIPSAIGLFILSGPILHLIFPGRGEGGEILRLLSISVVFIVLAQTLVSILQGVGNVTSPVKNIAIGALFKLFFVFILTSMPMLNISGAAISTILGYAVTAVLNFKDASECAYISFDIDKMFLRPLLSGIAMGIIVNMSYNRMIILSGNNGITTILSIIAGIIVYMIMLIITGSVSARDINNYIKYRRKRKR